MNRNDLASHTSSKGWMVVVDCFWSQFQILPAHLMLFRAYFVLAICVVNYIHILPIDMEQPRLVSEAKVSPV